MANKAKGEVGFEVDGKAHTLVYSINALCELESEGVDILTDVAALLTGTAKRRITLLRSVFRAGLLEHHPDISAKQAGEIVGAFGFSNALGKVAEAMALAFPASDGERPLAADPVDAARIGLS